MRVVGIDLGASAARAALPEAEGVRLLSFGVPEGAAPEPFGFDLARIESAGPISGAVLSVPICGSPAERRAVRDAARQAGLARVRLIPAPVAAALASLRQGDVGGSVLVLDVGQTGFSVAVLSIEGRSVEVLSTGFAPVGGDTFDRVVARHLAELWGPDAGPEVHAAAAREARRARHELTEHFEVRATLDVGTRHTVKLSRDQFEQRARAQLAQAEPTMRAALAFALLRPEDLDLVLLVGGCAYMPLVRRFATEVLGRRVRVPELPETWAAEGAAAYALALWGGTPPSENSIRVTGVLPRSVRAPALDDTSDRLLPRGCAVPAHATCRRPADVPLHLTAEADDPGLVPADLGEFRAPAGPSGALADNAGIVTWQVTADADGIVDAVAEGAPVVRAAESVESPARQGPARRRDALRLLARLDVWQGRGGVSPPEAETLRAALADANTAVPAAVVEAVDRFLEGVARGAG